MLKKKKRQLCLKEAEISVLSTLDLQDNIFCHAVSCIIRKPYSDLNQKVPGFILHADIHVCCESNALSDEEEMK